MNSGYQQYQKNNILTASQGELVLMLYNGAIKFCTIAIEATCANEIEKSHMYNIRVQEIITELQATLDTKYEIAKQMDAMYEFIRELLQEANIKKDVSQIEVAKQFLIEFRDMWKEVIRLNKVK